MQFVTYFVVDGEIIDRNSIMIQCSLCRGHSQNVKLTDQQFVQKQIS